MKENKIIYLREVNDNQITILEKVKEKRNIKTITGALKYVIEDYQSVCLELQSTKALLFKQTKELEKIQEEQKEIKKAWGTILKIVS